MKIAIPVNSKDINTARVDVRFGRAPYYYIYDVDNDTAEIVENPAFNARGGAGIRAVEFLIEKGVKVVIAPSIGENAGRIIRNANIKAYLSQDLPPQDLIEKWRRNELQQLM